MYFDLNVGHYVCSSENRYSKLVNVSGESTEPGFNEFGPLYKCCLINKTSKQFMKCPYNTNVRSDFTRHVRLTHKRGQFLCVYCSDTVHFTKLTTFEQPISLIRHVDVRHSDRFFQCNLCQYRAITADHVNLHQAAEHTATELENCRIFFCDNPKLPNDLSLKKFYENYKVDRVPENCHLYQCLYCNYSNEMFEDVIMHLVDEHQDRPLLYYSPMLKPVTNGVNEILTDDEDEFRDVIEVPITDNQKSNRKANLNNSVEEISTNDDSIIITKELKPVNGEILLTSDEDEEVGHMSTYICFFCATKSKSYNSAREHILNHLFESEGLKNHDKFFDQWVDLFLSSQHSLFDTTGAEENYEKLCPICARFNSIYNLETGEDPNRQRIHYILHSCFKPIQCLLCTANQYFLPKLMRKIVQHLTQDHSLELANNLQLRQLDLKNREKIAKFKAEDWIALKKKLVSLKTINEYSVSNYDHYQKLATVDQVALKLLETSYQSYLNQISPFQSNAAQVKLQSHLKFRESIDKQKENGDLPTIDVDLVTDDED